MRTHVSSAFALAAAALVGLSVVGAFLTRSPPGAEGEDETGFFGAPRAGADGLWARLADVGSPVVSSTPAGVPLAPVTASLAPTPSLPQWAEPLSQEAQVQLPVPDEYREFYFTRAVYRDYSTNSFWGRRRPSWAIDYPKADRQFLTVLKNLIDIDAYDRDNAVRLDDPRVRRYPFLYALEVGRMDMSDAEILGLRGYLEAGGFLVIDDFWGPREWANFEYQMSRVLPGFRIERLPLDHPIFNMVYDIEEIRQVPNVGNGTRGGPTWECRGCYPEVFGIHDENGRLMVVINWNTDLGDAWEWAENPYYPLEYSTFAYEMGVNMVVYGMSH
jgi:hypothetical protein